MPELETFRESYYYYSRQASDNVRKLAFAGLAIVWLFKIRVNHPVIGVDLYDVHLPKSLLWPVAAFALTLVLDLIHYLYGTIAWGIFCRYHELRSKGECAHKNLKAPRKINWLTNGLFASKAITVCIAYWLLGEWLLDQLF